MDWSDDAIILSTRPHGETALLVMALTRQHGRHAGLVLGGQSTRRRGVLEPGNRLAAQWRARLAEHLGTFVMELAQSVSAGFLDDPLRLAALSAALALAEVALPEREPHERIFNGLVALFDTLDAPVWAEAYVRWELGLLDELGFGLDLAACAATGRRDELVFVSPRTGRAVSLAAGTPYRDRLLALPGFLAGRGGGGSAEVIDGLALTGYFLERHVASARDAPLPAARLRFIERYRATAARSGSFVSS